MADNATLTNQKDSFENNTNSDIPTRSTERSGNQVQHVILDIGDGVESILSTSNPLPVSASSLPLPSGAATEATLSTLAGLDFATQTTLSALNAKVTAVDTGNIAGTVAATQSGTWNITNISGTVSLPTGAATAANQTTLNARFPAASTAADNVTNPSISKIGSYLFGFDGTTWDRLRGDSTNGLLVNLGSNNDVTVTGTVAATQSGTWNITDISGTISLPTGAATETTLNSILTDTDTINTNVATIAGAVSGTEMQVDVVTMPEVEVSSPDASTVSDTKNGSKVAVDVTSTAIASANSSRKVLVIQNQTNADISICLGSTATTANAFYVLHSIGSTVVIPGHLHDGAVSAIHTGTGTKNVLVFEQDE